mmetsp:Transcript_76054/g.217060  ORF Transcript_76054/g.217060 Transcript_76054/m.217060 type:complete len:307 (+) Transcript_76054:532-1452(+)
MLVRDTVTTTASCTNTSAAATRTNLAPPYRLEKETPWLIKALLQLDANEHVAELLKDTPALPVEGGASGEPEEAPRELSSRIQASALKNDIEASAFERYQDATTWAGSAHPLHDISVHTPLHFIDPSSHCAVQYSDLPGALVGFLTDRVVGAAASGYPVDIVPLQPKSREKLPCELWEMQMLVVGALASKTTESLDEEKQPIATLRKLALQRATIVLEACYRAGQVRMPRLPVSTEHVLRNANHDKRFQPGPRSNVQPVHVRVVVPAGEREAVLDRERGSTFREEHVAWGHWRLHENRPPVADRRA